MFEYLSLRKNHSVISSRVALHSWTDISKVKDNTIYIWRSEQAVWPTLTTQQLKYKTYIFLYLFPVVIGHPSNNPGQLHAYQPPPGRSILQAQQKCSLFITSLTSLSGEEGQKMSFAVPLGHSTCNNKHSSTTLIPQGC